ncbi:MAG: glutamate--tRNA ligase family protein [Pirellulales bacterium]|nr:glutamate--tRNA ligase family protein [Pirellulales bacterium]
MMTLPYRGRIAPTPSGDLHLGHGRTFWTAFSRARAAGGTLILRMEDLDQARCRPEYATGAIADLRAIGIDWSEGPDVGGPDGPYTQSERGAWYQRVWQLLQATGTIYPSPHSRRDVAAALSAPHEPEGPAPDDEEPIFPPRLRPVTGTGVECTEPGQVNWRFRVPDGRRIEFVDLCQGATARVAGVDFGDFLVWRKDGFPSYELAVVADDHAMHITEVVRGADLLTSTARQILLYEALGWPTPAWYHCPLVLDERGQRLAKRHAALSLRSLLERGEGDKVWQA